jgi:hypothetical protein
VPTKHHVVDSAGIRFNGVQRCQRLYGIEANLYVHKHCITDC